MAMNEAETRFHLIDPVLDSSYLYHFVQSDAFVSSLSSLVQGALYPAVTDKQVFSQLIPWVPIEEQRQIAARLKAQLAEVDKARKAAEKRSFDFEKLKQSILNEAFKQQNHTHIGETQKLFNCCSFFCGGTPTKGKDEYWKGKIPWFSPRDMKVWNLTSSTYYINEAAILKSATRLVDSGTVLFVGRSGILAHSFPVGILRQPSTFNQDIKAIVSKGAYDAEYIAFFLLSMQSYILKEGVKRGPTVHSLLSGFIEQLEIPILSIEEQRQIAARLKAQLAEVDKARLAAETQLREINLLPQKLLAQAFESTQP